MADKFVPTWMYKADGTAGLFKTQEDWDTKGDGWHDSPEAALEADKAPPLPPAAAPNENGPASLKSTGKK